MLRYSKLLVFVTSECALTSHWQIIFNILISSLKLIDGENWSVWIKTHRPVASHRWTILHRIALNSPHHEEESISPVWSSSPCHEEESNSPL